MILISFPSWGQLECRRIPRPFHTPHVNTLHGSENSCCDLAYCSGCGLHLCLCVCVHTMNNAMLSLCSEPSGDSCDAAGSTIHRNTHGQTTHAGMLTHRNSSRPPPRFYLVVMEKINLGGSLGMRLQKQCTEASSLPYTPLTLTSLTSHIPHPSHPSHPHTHTPHTHTPLTPSHTPCSYGYMLFQLV